MGLRISALAYDLATFRCTLASSEETVQWPLTTPRDKLVKSDARIVRHLMPRNRFPARRGPVVWASAGTRRGVRFALIEA